ncbi:MAG: nuclease-related domain-containing protein [Trueperaceae bacterium]|nr:nuclease-related domain-containing protein [Trueperaceae bacterium]
MSKRNTISPLKANPLRNPGQSVQDEIDKNREAFEHDAFMLISIAVIAGLSLYTWLMQTPPYMMFVVSSAGLVGYAIYALPKLRRRVRRHQVLKQHRDGKRAVAEYLDRLRDHGFRVLHDVVGDGIYLDHVLVGPQGVYVIETETVEKPAQGDASILYDGVAIDIAGQTFGGDVVAQVTAKAAWLESFLQESTDISISVQPVMVFPGWEVAQPEGSASLWVIEPKTLEKMLPEQPSVLKKGQIGLLSNALKQRIRSA